jgi:hypothetical protein
MDEIQIQNIRRNPLQFITIEITSIALPLLYKTAFPMLNLSMENDPVIVKESEIFDGSNDSSAFPVNRFFPWEL